MKLSIIIPCFNYGHLVEKAIASAATNHPEVEVIALNDGSTDNSLEVLKGLAEKYNFNLIDKKNSGVSSTRNMGIDIASGEYLMFLDADDYLTDDAIALCLNSIVDTQAKFIIAEHINISDNKRSLSKKISIQESHYDNVRRYITKELSIVNGGCLMHKDIFASRRYNPSLRNSEDIPMFIHALANFKTSSINFPIVNIIKHNDSRRHDISAILETGTTIVDDSFDEQYITGKVATLKCTALAYRHHSIAKACFKANKYQLAKQHYSKAFRLHPRFILNISFLKRMIGASLKKNH
ncbi:hypothetical protein SIN8267_02964 [Sinobacterium norvegicum]|uniref:Glycosyltransferase 2-like domain-containing protein n=1 Tax=Sinobacterium norvegicum TaxID=1641715 RepID=A0ABM9AI60_9GAMM|nr:glycosyltransferase family 2 protein [Sinobacterium norvegicum]CAH0992827.1 hypothetical protein SIN8267_02964 [Sinobacterium norvegicum]